MGRLCRLESGYNYYYLELPSEPFGSSPSQEPMNGSGITDRSFNELVSAGSAGIIKIQLIGSSHHSYVLLSKNVPSLSWLPEVERVESSSR